MLNGLMNIGQTALNSASAWISVTGNNLANADTEGYSRQYVDQKDAGGLTYRPGAQPLGVNAQQVLRFFDAFLEKSYVRQNANSSRWDQQDLVMASVENLFNEANRTGINTMMNNFFNAWQDLTLRPDDTSVRQSLLSYADNLGDMFHNTMDGLNAIKQEMDVSIRQGVDRVNDLAKAIADVNKQITASTVDGVSNPNALLDKRDQLVRELSTYVDVETIDHGKGNFRVQLATGQPLVDSADTYGLDFLPPTKENQLRPNSPYDGTINYEGTDSFEYTVEIVKGGDAGAKTGQPGNPTFRVSLDGGKTWLKDTDGNEIHYEITQANGEKDAAGKLITDTVQVKDLKISFSSVADFNAGDRFNITPKSGLYWIEPTRGPQNITPQIGFDGVDNPNRVTGGKLAAYFNVRDDNIGRYEDELNAVASTLIWEVNRLHSQGAGLQMHNNIVGTEGVGNATAPLGTAQAMLTNYDRLQEGNVQIHFYNTTVTPPARIEAATLTFTDGDKFNPEKHTLEDVRDAFNRIRITDKDNPPAKLQPIVATIQDGKLLLNSTEGMEFAMGMDSTGLMAALGINTFFSGSNAGDIAVNSSVHMNTQLIAAGQVNGAGEINTGDNATATAIGQLASKPVTITTFWKTVENQSVSQYYANLVTTVGTDRRLTKTNTEYHTALTNDLYDRVSSVSGVNMDEEMSNLIKFQHSYTAAAKLITTADQMLQTLLGLKQ